LTRQEKNGRGGKKVVPQAAKWPEASRPLAFPAAYRSSGGITFIVNGDGVAYQKDLGRNTDTLAKAMKDARHSSWQKAEEQQEKTAGDQKNK
jgi:hypothetical protein